MSARRRLARVAAGLALVLSVVACPVDIGLQEPDSGLVAGKVGSRIEVIHGQGQTAPPGTTLPQSLRIRLLDADDEPMDYRKVTWTVTSGGGTVSRFETYTDVGGLAETRWTLGDRLGRQTVLAGGAGLVAEFTAEAATR